MAATNGRPGWRDVLHAVEHSEERILSEVTKNSAKITAIDKRTLNLENDRIRRETQQGTIVSLIGGGRALLAGVLGAIAALCGMGLLGL